MRGEPESDCYQGQCRPFGDSSRSRQPPAPCPDGHCFRRRGFLWEQENNMSLWLLLALIFAPAVFWIGYAYYHDRFEPEPLVMAAFSYFLGFLAGWLCLHAYGILLPVLGIPADPEPSRD